MRSERKRNELQQKQEKNSNPHWEHLWPRQLGTFKTLTTRPRETEANPPDSTQLHFSFISMRCAMHGSEGSFRGFARDWILQFSKINGLLKKTRMSSARHCGPSPGCSSSTLKRPVFVVRTAACSDRVAQKLTSEMAVNLDLRKFFGTTASWNGDGSSALFKSREERWGEKLLAPSYEIQFLPHHWSL